MKVMGQGKLSAFPVRHYTVVLSHHVTFIMDSRSVALVRKCCAKPSFATYKDPAILYCQTCHEPVSRVATTCRPWDACDNAYWEEIFLTQGKANPLTALWQAAWAQDALVRHSAVWEKSPAKIEEFFAENLPSAL